MSEKRCQVCCGELSHCGEMTADGPRLDCKVCLLLAENSALKAEAERNRWALSAMVALEAAVRESVIRPTKDTEVNATNALLTVAGDNRQLRSELARFKEAAELLAKESLRLVRHECLEHESPGCQEAAFISEMAAVNPTAALLVEQARKEKA